MRSLLNETVLDPATIGFHKFKSLAAIIILGILGLILIYLNLSQVNESKINLLENTSRAPLDLKTIFRDGRNLNLTQNDTRLLNFIRKNHLFPPSKLPYNLTDPKGDPTHEYGKLWSIAHTLLGNKRNGFFIECGALDGENLSNTLVLERDFGWTGLLIEADTRHLRQIFLKHRKAWIADTCLSLVPFPQELRMQRHKEWSGLGRLVDPEIPKLEYEPDEFTVKCFPLFSVLSAIGVFEIDYFSLDIEKSELHVLKTIPFDSVYIKVFSIEVFRENAKAYREFMESKGYVCLMFVEAPYVHDFVFIHTSLYKEGMISEQCSMRTTGNAFR